MYSRKTYLLLFMALWLGSCSTQKNTWLTRNYHSITSKYNTLFNGQQSFQRGEQQLMHSHSDNFTHILRIFPYTGAEKAGAVKGDMDRAIDKGYKIARNKSITARPNRSPSQNDPRHEAFYNRREFNRYMDDAYILIGKAHLYNHEFNDALMILEYVLREFPNQPARFEALIWMARTRLEMGDYENAFLLLKRYESEGEAPDQYYGEYMATYADYLIRTGQNREAIPYMKAALEEARGKWNRSRRMYILAQLYQATDQYELAAENFRRVVRSNPYYEMDLNARINYILTQGHVNSDQESARRQLYRQVNHINNREYRDRIYYLLAQSYLNENDTISAITNLRLSAGYNFNDEPLRTETYLQLADLYFSLPSYIPSYAYYDSTLISIPAYDQRNREIQHRHTGLKDLTTHFETIEREDSLQQLAAMPEDDLDQFIAAIIEQERQAQLNEAMGASHDQAMRGSAGMLQRNVGRQLGRQADSQGGWYFYNTSTASLGKMEFERRWGRRSNEDNWRRSDQGSLDPVSYEAPSAFPGEPSFSEEESPLTEEAQPNGGGPLTNLPTKEELMNDIPFTVEQKLISGDKMANAYFQAGMVFLEHFNDPPKAIEMFRMFVTDYPTHQLAEQAWFWAYMSYLEMNNQQGAEEMKNGLLTYFPDGKYTEFARNPEHAEIERHKKNQLNQLYDEAFKAYHNNQFNEVISATTKIIQDAGEEEEMIRKSRLLRSVTFGKQGNTLSFESELRILSDQYPSTQEGRMAQLWLAMLKEGKEPVPGVVIRQPSDQIAGIREVSETDEEPVSLFNYQSDQEQYIILLVENNADINKLLFNLADYNFSRFMLADYDLNSQILPDGRRIITIGAFSNQRELMDYYYALRSNPQLLRAGNVENPMLMGGTKENFDNLVGNGETEAYRDFFSTNYLSGGGGITIQMAFLDEVASGEEEPAQTTFTTTDGIHWAMIVLPPRTSQNRVTGFLTGHALNTFNMRITTRTVNLSGGETVLLLESFNSRNEANEFITSLKENAFWNNQLRADQWLIASVSPDNFEIIHRQGSTNEYYEFSEE